MCGTSILHAGSNFQDASMCIHIRTIGTVVSISASWDEWVSWFRRRLDAEFQTTNHVGTATLDMYFFSIFHKAQFYVMCISFKHAAFVIIDSSSTANMGTVMYGTTPEELRDLLAAYLDSKQHIVRALRLRNMQPERMQLAWSDTPTNGDSGVYAMRHMEAFVGQDPRCWQCGLGTGGPGEIENMRKRFLHNILLSTVNGNMHNIRTRAGEYDGIGPNNY
ncbi:PREDICTED: uncharacterized protein LOC109189840 [Ipomoea nil]|uniref:uncharacterized protein LOC109189840 n=1 Tax=Ipomoea nil TaxID=35883 RepID=UPI000901E79B|nr:PREDICTED: uncharacterized protein LOC109189840 [Ipomoea nil]XP_019196011.1 PREDICTED: uncharacterized protein LOC109189840 [Ipomoea nil]